MNKEEQTRRRWLKQRQRDLVIDAARDALARIEQTRAEPYSSAGLTPELMAYLAEQVGTAARMAESDARAGRPSLVAAANLSKAVDYIAAASAFTAFGMPIPELVYLVGFYVGAAQRSAGEANERSEKASGKGSASRRLRELKRSNPALNAAELRRMLERETGVVMDDSLARAVLRKARA